MSLNSKLQKQGKVRKSCCLKTFHESHFVMVLFCIALLKCGSKEVLYHCTTLKKLSMPETLDLSYKQSISAPKKTVCKLNMMLCLLQEGTISTLITLYDIGTSVKSKQQLGFMGCSKFLLTWRQVEKHTEFEGLFAIY